MEQGQWDDCVSKGTWLTWVESLGPHVESRDRRPKGVHWPPHVYDHTHIACLCRDNNNKGGVEEGTCHQPLPPHACIEEWPRVCICVHMCAYVCMCTHNYKLKKPDFKKPEDKFLKAVCTYRLWSFSLDLLKDFYCQAFLFSTFEF